MTLGYPRYKRVSNMPFGDSFKNTIINNYFTVEATVSKVSTL